MYDRLLSQGRPAPVPEEGTDWVKVTIQRRIVKPEVMRLVTAADERFQLTQRERITLGALALSEGMTARELVTSLELDDVNALRPWLGRLLDLELIQRAGQTKGMRYFIEPTLLQSANIALTTSLKRIEPHRLQALVVEDLSRYPGSSSGAINRRIGVEIKYKTLKRALDTLCQEGMIRYEGMGKGRKYWVATG
jgi:ATP-dependent DNA helicase RecG